ncbi:MAG: UDP-glucose/GDP-mannose dehydrogenase family protein [Armatimonadetes bacterium]|nr:UDP-glucose/GDP-mannose dehydrogenase family protein [Armatimonadota bacterium]
MRITVVGTGYVGLVTSVCLAHIGHEVIGLDVDEAKIACLQAGDLPIYEGGLEPLMREQMRVGRLRFEHDYAQAIPDAEAIFICVGTPALPDGSADTRAVQAAAEAIGAHLGPGYTVIVNKSTVPVGSGDWVGMLVREGAGRATGCRTRSAAGVTAAVAAAARWSEAERPSSEVAPRFAVVANPEFLREGSALRDALHPDRIVIGADDEDAVAVMRHIYARLIEQRFRPVFSDVDPPDGVETSSPPVPFVVTDRTSAELIKYAANAFLATKISFVNEIANICERVGADVREVARGIGLDRRIGASFLSAGIGWGGSCFPKDLASLVQIARDYGHECRLLEAARAVNQEQRLVVVRKLQERLKVLKGKTVALWGLAFKPGTDDIRDAPALAIARRLVDLSVRVVAYDPVAGDAFQAQVPEVRIARDPYAAAEEADAVVLVTEWPEFAGIDWRRLRSLMRRPLIVDGRNFLDDAALLWHGFEYCGIGR